MPKQARRRAFGGPRPQQIQIQMPQVLTAEQVVEIVKQHQTTEKTAYNAKPDAVVSVANKTWDDFEKEMEWMEQEEERRNLTPAYGYNGKTLYIEAWDMRPIMDFAAAHFESLAVGSVMSSIHNIDIIGYIGYVCALAETYVLSNPEVIGVAGITAAAVDRAKSFIKSLSMPEIIAQMLLQLRPIQLFDGTKVVLLPHKFDRAGMPAAGHIVWNGAGNLQIDLRQHDCYLENQRVLGIANNITNANITRTNWFKVLADIAETRHDQEYYMPNALNAALQTTFFTKMYAVCARTEQLFDNANDVLFENEVWTVWFNYGFSEFVSSAVRRRYIGFGNISCYSVKTSFETPIRVQDATGNIQRESRKGSERWVPWFMSATDAGLLAFEAEIRAVVPTCLVNCNHPVTRAHISSAARIHRCFALATGHGAAMTSNIHA